MYQIYAVFFLAFVFTPGVLTDIIEDGQDVEIKCDPGVEKLLYLFKVTETGAVFISSYSNGVYKAGDREKFILSKKGPYVVTLKGFDKTTDSGTYSCVASNMNQLFFSKITRLSGKPAPTEKPKQILTTSKNKEESIPKVTTAPCIKKESKEKNLAGVLGCEMQIFIPLSVGCGLLLLLQIVTILYCNRIRTRRCPHHYKRQARSAPTGHKALPNPGF